MTTSNGVTFERQLEALRDSLKSFLSSAAHQVKDKAVDIKDHAASGTRGAASKVGEAIKAHPIAAVGLAFGIGYIVVRAMRK